MKLLVIIILSAIVILILSLSVWLGVVFFKWVRARIARVFTQNYEELKQLYPTPLYTWKVWGVFFHSDPWNIDGYPVRRIFKLDVYEDMLIVSTGRKGACLRYDQCVLKYEKALFGHWLDIEILPVQEKSEGAPSGPTENLRLDMSTDKINIILQLAHQGFALR